MQRGGKMKREKVCSLIIAIGVLFTVACRPQSESTGQVTTTTDKGASVAPSAKEAESQDKALVRVINAYPDMKSMDTFVGDNPEFMDVAYKTVTPYKAVPEKLEQFSIKPTGEKNALSVAENKELISGGNHYTAIAMPASDNKATLRVVGDKLTPPSSGKASVRIIHASPDVEEVDVFVKGKDDKLFSGVNPQTVTDFNEIDPMTATLEFRPQNRTEVLLTVPNMTFQPGHNYTIVVAGKTKDNPKLEVIKIDDKLNIAARTPQSSPSPTATLSR
jgi:hypothetical protein